MEGIQDRADIEEQDFPDEFQCCVCLDIMYKPVVLGCGHISCFWCTFKAMNYPKSHCPVCRDTYNHFPRICELLHSLLLKLYPSAYARRAGQVAEEEKDYGSESPQLDNCFAEESCKETGQLNCNEDATSKLPTSSSQTITKEADSMTKSVTTVLVTDVQCAACKQLLYRPAVLNCGHVSCESCIHPDDSIYRCPTCQSTHPKGCPNVCLLLHHFLEEHFPKEYSARKESLAHFQRRTPSSSLITKHEQTEEASSSPSAPRASFHPFVGCDNCGMCPIIGLRYRCKDCVEKIGFDLCEDCYKSSSKLPGRFNQQHTEDHQFEVIQPTNAIIVFGGQLYPDVDGSIVVVGGGELHAEDDGTGGLDNDGTGGSDNDTNNDGIA